MVWHAGVIKLHRIVLVLLSAAALCAAPPDWPAAKREALETLQDLIRLDTSQPAGNEIRAARYLEKKLAAEGIESQVFEAEPGRASIVARLKGSGAKRPLLLLGHLDVVAVERDEWSFDPFGGVVKDGILYGRGAADDKSVVTGSLMALLLLKRLHVPLDRDVIFLGVADEEAGGVKGITYMLENHRDAIDAEYAINEGGGGQFDRTGRYTQWLVQTAEKTPRRINLEAHGQSGHGSIPKPDNAIAALARAVAKLFAYETPVRLNETTRTFFERLAASAPPDQAPLYRKLLAGKATTEDQERLREINPYYYSMIRTSINPTIIQGGYLRNVVPSEAHATVDIRALPDEDPEAFFSQLKQVIGEPNVDLIPHKVTRPAHQPVPLDSPLFKAFEKVIGERYSAVPLLPLMSTGATDSAQLRAAGIKSYGFGVPKPEWDPSSGVHGKDEYIYVKAFEDYFEALYNVVVETAGSAQTKGR